MFIVNFVPLKTENMEVWKSIRGYENIYEVSNLGRVRSLKHIVEQVGNKGTLFTRCYDGRVLTQRADIGGYPCVCLSNGSSKKTIQVHKLVAKAFVPNPNNFPQINHKDENKSNNHSDNLEWCTPSYNCNYGTRIDKIIAKTGKTIGQFDKEGNFIRTFPSVSEASRTLGISISSIASMANGRKRVKNGKEYERKSVGGFVWRWM